MIELILRQKWYFEKVLIDQMIKVLTFIDLNKVQRNEYKIDFKSVKRNQNYYCQRYFVCYFFIK